MWYVSMVMQMHERGKKLHMRMCRCLKVTRVRGMHASLEIIDAAMQGIKNVMSTLMSVIC